MTPARTAAALAARLHAAAHTASRRHAADHDDAGAAPDHSNDAALQEALSSTEIPALWSAYGRRLWPLGDDITDDRVLVEGRDQRSHAALNHYLREGAPPRAHRCPTDRPRVNAARVSFHPTDDEDTLRITYHPAPAPTSTTAATHPDDLTSFVAPERILDVLVADR